jgi:hypothetical protein
MGTSATVFAVDYTTYNIVIYLAYVYKWLSFAGLVLLVEPLKKTCTTKVKANSVKQEYEKQDELKRSAMRAVSALLAIPSAGKFFYVKQLCHHFCFTFNICRNYIWTRECKCRNYQ